MKKLLACLTLFVIMSGFLSGCWSRKELSELAIVLGAGVDRTPDNQVRLTLQLARPGAFVGGGEAAGGKEPPTWVVSETGKTVEEAQRRLATRISRHIYWAHNVVLIFGEEAARYGLLHYTDFFIRAPQPRETTWVMVAGGEAKDILETHSELERSSAQDIGNLARNKTGYAISLKDLVVLLAASGGNPVTARVDVVENGVLQGSGTERSPVQKGVALTGTAVFRNDKLVGWLDESETRGLIWLRGEVLKGVITIPSLSGPDKNMSVEIVHGRTEVEPQYDGESVWFNVKITVVGDLTEQQSYEDILDREVRDAINREISGDVEGKARLALIKAQGEYGVDIFNFGTAFHRKYPRDWANLKDRWDQVFAGAGVNIEVEARVRSGGLQSRRTAATE